MELLHESDVLLLGRERPVVARLRVLSNAGVYRVEVAIEKRVVSEDRDDAFESLLAVRRVLEKEHLRVGVLGATKNVWPSRMTLEMSGGMTAYRMTLGKQALQSDLVRVFDGSHQPVLIEEQLRYKDEWFASLGT